MDFAFGSLPLQSHQLNACSQTGELGKTTRRSRGEEELAEGLSSGVYHSNIWIVDPSSPYTGGCPEERNRYSIS